IFVRTPTKISPRRGFCPEQLESSHGFGACEAGATCRVALRISPKFGWRRESPLWHNRGRYVPVMNRQAEMLETELRNHRENPAMASCFWLSPGSTSHRESL